MFLNCTNVWLLWSISCSFSAYLQIWGRICKHSAIYQSSRRPKVLRLFSFISSFLVFIVSYYHKVIFFHPICEQNKSLQKCWKTPSINLDVSFNFLKKSTIQIQPCCFWNIYIYIVIYFRLVGCSPQGLKESDMTEQLSTTVTLEQIYRKMWFLIDKIPVWSSGHPNISPAKIYFHFSFMLLV